MSSLSFLAARRRHPAARPLLILAALLLVGAAYTLFLPTNSVEAQGATDPQVAQGEEIFAISCSSCHGMNGEGTSQGPSLVGVGAASVDFQMGTGRMPMNKPGQQFPRKASDFTPEEIAAVAAYVQSLSPGLAIPTEEQYSPEGLTAEEIARGGEIFRSNCSACHNIMGMGGAMPEGKYAPSLHGVESRHIYEAVRIGPQQMPRFAPGTMSDEDVRQVIAYLRTVEEAPNYGGNNLGGTGPVGEGLFIWTIGLGALVGFAMWIAAKGARAK